MGKSETISYVEEPPVLPFDAATLDAPVGLALSLEFTGTTREYFSIWAVTQLLTVLTLGLYGPWSRTRRAAYLSQHWRMGGESFDVQYRPREMLQGRLLVFFVLLATISLTWLMPLLAPVFIIAAFFIAPKLLANSFAFRWRTLKYRGIGFDANNDSKPIRNPMIYLGLGLAIAAIPTALWKDALGQGFWFMMVAFTSILPLIFLWPRATSALTHLRFSAARYGSTSFDLQTTPAKIHSHMWRNSMDGWFFLFMVLFLSILIVSFVFIEDDDILAVVGGLTNLAVTVYGVTFARGRRINFVLHRLKLGGLSFTTSLNATRAGMYTAGYALLAVATLGLSLPWSTIHYNRWRAQLIQPYLEGEWIQFAAAQTTLRGSGAWDEMANAFDIEIGL